MIHYQRKKGAFIKHCPCSPEVVSCGYYNLNLHTGCPYSCSYCILQAYLDSREPIFYTNISDLKKELAVFARDKKYVRIGSGELSDSLAMDNETNYSLKLLKIFADYPQLIFEFKTKSTRVDNLLGQKRVLKNIVISWSLNPPKIIKGEEHLTPDLGDRIKVIDQVQAMGYKIGIHFDPLVIFPGWKIHYESLIKLLAELINPARVAWWSLGALRFPQEMRQHILKYKDSILFAGELIKGYDHKYRYFKPLRLELFHFVKQKIQALISRDLPLYLCMEDQEVWQEIFPGVIPQEAEINKYLYQAHFT